MQREQAVGVVGAEEAARDGESSEPSEHSNDANRREEAKRAREWADAKGAARALGINGNKGVETDSKVK